jgi:hypothetical protein
MTEGTPVTHQDIYPRKTPKGVLAIIIAGALIGLATFGVGVRTYGNTEQAEKGDIDRTIAETNVNQTLIEQLQRVVEHQERESHEHRVRNEEVHACLVELIFMVISTPRHRMDEITNPCPEPLFSVEPPQVIPLQGTTSTTTPVTRRARPRPRTPTENARAAPPPGTTTTTTTARPTTTSTTQPSTTTTHCDVPVPTRGCVNP